MKKEDLEKAADLLKQLEEIRYFRANESRKGVSFNIPNIKREYRGIIWDSVLLLALQIAEREVINKLVHLGVDRNSIEEVCDGSPDTTTDGGAS